MQTQQHKRVLSDRISRQQKTKLLELMREHPDLGRGSIRGVDNIDFFWQKFTRILNTCMGAKKKSGQWKRSWIDWKASVKKQFAALVAFDKGNWTREDRPKPIEFLDLQIVEYITNLPPECANYDVFVLNDTIKGLRNNASRSMSPVDHMEFQTGREPVSMLQIDSTIKQERDEQDFENSQTHLKYENDEDDTEFEINFLEEPSETNSTYLNENYTPGLPPLHPIGGPIVRHRTNRTEFLLEQLLKEQRRTNDLLQKTLTMLVKSRNT